MWLLGHAEVFRNGHYVLSVIFAEDLSREKALEEHGVCKEGKRTQEHPPTVARWAGLGDWQGAGGRDRDGPRITPMMSWPGTFPALEVKSVF